MAATHLRPRMREPGHKRVVLQQGGGVIGVTDVMKNTRLKVALLHPPQNQVMQLRLDTTSEEDPGIHRNLMELG